MICNCSKAVREATADLQRHLAEAQVHLAEANAALSAMSRREHRKRPWTEPEQYRVYEVSDDGITEMQGDA